GRLFEPEKMTSSMEEARIDLYEDSPMTQRTASTRLDLPQPLGPTTPVKPGSIRKSVGSTKDLNPIRRSRVSFMQWPLTSFCFAHDLFRKPFGVFRDHARRANERRFGVVAAGGVEHRSRQRPGSRFQCAASAGE